MPVLIRVAAELRELPCLCKGCIICVELSVVNVVFTHGKDISLFAVQLHPVHVVYVNNSID